MYNRMLARRIMAYAHRYGRPAYDLDSVQHGLPVGSGIGADAYTERGGQRQSFCEGQEKIAKIALSRL
jgi:hypothetical protein